MNYFWKKSIALLILLVMTMGLAIGYAALVDNLSIIGNAHVEPQEIEGVYITAIELVRSSNASAVSADRKSVV